MIQKSTLDFLKKLKKNNNKAWMDNNRILFENAKVDFRNLLAGLIKEMGKFDSDIAELEPKQCTFRQNRDIRFSTDKSPYKLAFGAFMNRGGKKVSSAGYYIHIEPGNCFIAAGWWMPEKDSLAAIRQEIDYNVDEFKSILNQKGFKKYFPEGLDRENTLTRPPKGYDDENAAIAFLKLKSFTISSVLDDVQIQKNNLLTEITSIFKQTQPFIKFLNRTID